MARPRPRHIARRSVAVRLRANRRALSWLGAALALAGPASMAFPEVATLVVGAVSGWLLWFAGAVLIVASLLVGARGAVGAAVVAGLIAIASGALLLFFPSIGALAATILVAAVLIVDGAFELAVALNLRPLSAWRWVLASAFASAVAALVTVVVEAGRSESLVALVLGLAFACSGLALMALGRSRRGGVQPKSQGAVVAGHRR